MAAGLLAASTAWGQTPADPLSRSWKRLVTPAFTVFSEGSDASLRETATAVESFRAALRLIFPAARLDPIVPTYLVVFDSDDSFNPFKPLSDGRRRTNVAGYAMFADEVNYLVMGRSRESTETYRTVYHEYTHYVMRRTFANQPFWYSEGVGELFSTLAGSTHDSRPIIGRPIPYYVETLSTQGTLPIKDMLVDERAAKHARDFPDRFYATAWLMSHYFLLDPQRQQALMNVFNSLAKGTDLETSVMQGLGVSLDQLQLDVNNYLRRSKMPGIGVTADAAAIQGAVERVTEIELARLHGDLLVKIGDLKPAERLVDGALAKRPADDGLRTVKARLLLSQDRAADAVAVFASSPPVSERSATSLRAEGAALLALGRVDDAAAVLTRAEALGRPSPALLYALGRVHMTRASWPEATATFARLRAADADPKWDLARTFEAYRLGYGVYVVGTARAFITKVGWADPSSPYAAFAGALALRRDKRNEEAEKLLQDVDANTADDQWPAPVVTFLLTRRTAAELIAAATTDRERTEAHAYVGLAASAGGRRDEAIEHLTWVKDKGEEMIERSWARAELARLAAAQPER